MARTPPRGSVAQCKDCAEAGKYHFDLSNHGSVDMVGNGNDVVGDDGEVDVVVVIR